MGSDVHRRGASTLDRDPSLCADQPIPVTPSRSLAVVRHVPVREAVLMTSPDKPSNSVRHGEWNIGHAHTNIVVIIASSTTPSSPSLSARGGHHPKRPSSQLSSPPRSGGRPIPLPVVGTVEWPSFVFLVLFLPSILTPGDNLYGHHGLLNLHEDSHFRGLLDGCAHAVSSDFDRYLEYLCNRAKGRQELNTAVKT